MITTRRALLALICLAVVAQQPANACGMFALVCKAKEAIKQVASTVLPEARDAFDQAMDHVFDDDLQPLLNKAQVAINADIQQIGAEVNATIAHVQFAVESVIQDAAQTANALAHNITACIQKIIGDATQAIETVENTFYQDTSKILSQLNQIVQKGQCMEAGGAKQLQDQIYKLLEGLHPQYRLSKCWRSLGHKFSTTLEELSDIQLYEYQKQCTLLNMITPTTPIKGAGGILELYAQGQLYAAEYYCIGETANAPAFQNLFTKEWVWWGEQYNAWNTITTRTVNKKARAHDVSLDVPPPPPPPPPPGQCGTPVECYAEAIQKLKDAEAMIEGLRSKQDTIVANIAQLNGTTTINAEKISGNNVATMKAIDANAKVIDANAKVMNDHMAHFYCDESGCDIKWITRQRGDTGGRLEIQEDKTLVFYVDGKPHQVWKME